MTGSNILKIQYVLMALPVWISLLSCSKEEGDKRFTSIGSDQTGVKFINTVQENGQFNMVDFYYVYNGGGVSAGDLNNDGLPELFFTGNMVPDHLYLNKGELKFDEVTIAAGINHRGWSTGTTFADVNADGFLDIYISRSGNVSPDERANLLYINNGDLTFTEAAATYGVNDKGYSTQAAFFDYDKDGDLDLFVVNHTNDIRNPSQPKPIVSDGSGLANDRLYRNEGTGFTDVTKEAGILFDGMGLGLGICDFNGDGWDDVYVSNDFMAHDFIYINQGDGTFKESSGSYFKHMSHFGMGNDLADINNDGLIDAITLDMLPPDNYHRKKMSGPMNANLFEYTLKQGLHPQYMRNTLQLNRGNINQNGEAVFEEIGQLSGVDATDWSWCPLFADFDNDGWNDLFITNGYLRDITDLDFINYTANLSQRIKPDSLDEVIKVKAKEMPSLVVPNFMFQNQKDLTFHNKATDWGLDQKGISNGACYADLDSDGDLEIIINNTNEPASIYKNNTIESAKGNFIEIQLEGGDQNTKGIGSLITLYHNGTTQTRQLHATRGFQSSSDYILHFGLGQYSQVDSIQVMWPDNTVTVELNPSTNQRIKIIKESTTKLAENNKSESKLFNPITGQLGLNYKHEDLYYNDFSRQFLLPHKHSQQGPSIAVADINGDGLEDFFVGGSYRYSGRLFFQQTDGAFIKINLETDSLKFAEDIGSLFFDADQDGDQDLYVVSGSNEYFANSEYFQDRLYKNDGVGNFTLDQASLPDLLSSGSCVKAADFDQDGDLDLFVGGRLTPLQYPQSGTSHLLINENGKFREETSGTDGLQKTGMVTDALWTDFNADGWVDLMVVGEFMEIKFFQNEQGIFNDVTDEIGLANTEGWWNSINGVDMDQDGDIDYILGNLGVNSRYKASVEEPIRVYSNDFDNNGFQDAILTHYLEGKEYPTHSRDDITGQIRSWKQRINSYGTYAKSQVSELLTEKEIAQSMVLKATNFQTSYLENLGNSKFQLKPLPLMAQKGPVFGIALEDIDSDGTIDVILSGNSYATEVVVGRYDAMNTEVFLGNGDGSFNYLDPKKSGLHISGDNRSLAKIEINGKKSILFGRNSSAIEASQFTEPTASISVDQDVRLAEFIMKDGKKRVQEVYYGSSCLAQSTRKLSLPKNVVSLNLTNYRNETKEISLSTQILTQNHAKD